MIDVREVDWSDPRGEALRTAQRDELTVRYESPDSEPGQAPTAADISVFLVAFDGELAIACGGLRKLDPVHGEVKRMYVAPERRGSGIAADILHALEAWARQRGWQRLVLETGERQPDAIRFYEREGYARIPNFGHYVNNAASICYERTLS